MQCRFSLPFISALVVAASVTSCQRKAEEAFSPAGEIAFTVVSPSQTKSSDAETSPVSIPVKSDGVQGLTLEVSSRPWAVEESSTAATKVTPSSSSYFTSSHNDFYVAAYSSTSSSPSASTTKEWEKLARYDDDTSKKCWVLSASSWPSSGTYQTFCCWAPTTVSFNSSNISFTVNSTVSAQTDLLVSKSGPSAPVTPGSTVELNFTHALTGVKFAAENITITGVEIKGINKTGTYNVLTQQWSGQTGSQNYSVTSNVTAESSTMMLIPQTLGEGATIKVNTNKGSVTIFLNGQTWEAGEMVTYKITYRPPFTFSVSSGTKVAFSKGNLQAYYPTTGSTTPIWQFAENQWDRVGDDINNTTITGKGGAQWQGSVDLFGWSTTNTSYGIWNSGTDGDYAGNFVDWGNNQYLESTLGSGWRTLTSAEWTYLLNSRTGYRYCKATVNSVPGLVIFPDGYSSGVTAINSENTQNANFNSNTWSGDAWTKMEAAGCVFLPAAGIRFGTGVDEVDVNGYYWSSTSSADLIYNNGAYSMYFSGSMLQTESSGGRLFGRSVRLVANQ